MKSEAEFRSALRGWILEHGMIAPAELRDDTPIIERRIVSSVKVMDLILFLEELRDATIDVESLKPGVFRSIDVIVANFCAGASHA